jgi:hypothetical protein
MVFWTFGLNSSKRRYSGKFGRDDCYFLTIPPIRFEEWSAPYRSVMHRGGGESAREQQSWLTFVGLDWNWGNCHGATKLFLSFFWDLERIIFGGQLFDKFPQIPHHKVDIKCGLICCSHPFAKLAWVLAWVRGEKPQPYGCHQRNIPLCSNAVFSPRSPSILMGSYGEIRPQSAAPTRVLLDSN